MNRHQRRAKARDPHSARKMRELQDRVNRTGRPGRIYGLIDACVDCHATAEIVVLPSGQPIAHVFHQDGCPAANGITTWAPCPD